MTKDREEHFHAFIFLFLSKTNKHDRRFYYSFSFRVLISKFNHIMGRARSNDRILRFKLGEYLSYVQWHIHTHKIESNEKSNKLGLIVNIFPAHGTWTILPHPFADTRRMVFVGASQDTNFLTAAIRCKTNRTFRHRFAIGQAARRRRRWETDGHRWRLCQKTWFDVHFHIFSDG